MRDNKDRRGARLKRVPEKVKEGDKMYGRIHVCPEFENKKMTVNSN